MHALVYRYIVMIIHRYKGVLVHRFTCTQVHGHFGTRVSRSANKLFSSSSVNETRSVKTGSLTERHKKGQDDASKADVRSILDMTIELVVHV